MDSKSIKNVVIASKNLDDLGLYKEADIITEIMHRIADTDMSTLGPGVSQLTDNVQLKPGMGYGANPQGSIAANAPGAVPDSPLVIPTPNPGEDPAAFQKRVQDFMSSPDTRQRMQSGDQQQRSQNMQFSVNQLNQRLQQIGQQLQAAPQGPQRNALQQQYNALQQSIGSVGQMLNQSFNPAQQTTPVNPASSVTPAAPGQTQNKIDYNKLSRIEGM